VGKPPGLVLIVAGYAWSLTALGESSASIPYSVGRVVAWTVPPILIYLMLAFPDGRLGTPIERGLFGVCLPVVAMSIACAGTLVAFQAARRSDAGGELADDLGVIWSLTVPGAAGAFLVGMIRQRVMLGETLSALSRDLNRKVDLSDTRRTLARVLGDDSVEVLVPDVATRGWRDTRGAFTSIATLEASGRRLTIVRDDDGAPVAAIAHDPRLHQDDELTDSVGGYIRASTQHAHVTRQLARSLVELDQSRARIARAADAEQSRIERDLHDGAQQRLIALRIHLSMAEELDAADPRQWAETLKRLGIELDETLDELRALAHGVYPSLLADRGLAEALRGVAADAPASHQGSRSRSWGRSRRRSRPPSTSRARRRSRTRASTHMMRAACGSSFAGTTGSPSRSTMTAPASRPTRPPTAASATCTTHRRDRRRAHDRRDAGRGTRVGGFGATLRDARRRGARRAWRAVSRRGAFGG
jgi:signal transduction histidine kinase